jgi:ribosomal protein S27E
MNYKIECPHCEAETVVQMPYDEPPSYCPVCGDPLPEEAVEKHDGSCLC